ncbi:MAG TPA: hypothetical protein VHA75_15670, partial [Rugosimonospora sp.]|nr:hypothetical protein [Rugosimonospora sp.]
GAVAPEQRAGGGDDPTDVIDVRPVRSDLADLARSLERDRPHPVAATGAAHPRDAGAHLAALVPGPGGSAGPPGDPAADPTAVLNFKTLRAGLALLEKGEAVAHTGHRPGQRARGVAAVPIMDPGQVVGSVQMVFVPDDADEGEDGAGGDEETRDFGWFR